MFFRKGVSGLEIESGFWEGWQNNTNGMVKDSVFVLTDVEDVKVKLSLSLTN
jgi:hypothetical protein